MSKSILHITDHLGVGGTEVLMKNTVPLLNEYNHVICYLGGDAELKSTFSDYPVYSLGHRGKKDLYRTIKRLRKIISKHEIEIIHAHLFWATIIARLAKPKKVKLLSTIHSLLSKDAFQKNKLSLWAERLTVNRQDALIAVSNYALQDYLEHVSFIGNTHVLYNFIPDNFFQQLHMQSISLENETLKCIAVGNIKGVKNYSFVLNAFEGLKEYSISLDIFGDGADRSDLQQLINERKLQVAMKGVHHNISEILPAYQVFIQMSLHEGFGIALVEAMACGLIPVLSNIPVHREVAGDCAIYIDLDNTQNLTTTLKTMYNDKTEWQFKRELCRQRAKEIASKENYLKQLRLIYNSLPQ